MKLSYLIGLAVLVGCANENPAEFAPIPGGGVAGAVTDTLTVFAVDARTGEPITSAVVFPSLEADTGMAVDAAGRAELGATIDVRIEAPGYQSTAWLGINGAAVTVPLASLAPVPATDVQVRLEGVDQAPGGNGYLTAFFGTTRNLLLFAPGSDVNLQDPAQSCGRIVDRCELTLSVPHGATQIFATIAEGDDQGTMDPSDDTFSAVGFALTELLMVDSSIREATLTAIDSEALVAVSVDLPTPPSNIAGSVIGVPGVRTGDEVIIFGAATAPAFRGPDLAQSVGGGAYWAVAIAQDDRHTSAVLARQLAVGPQTGALTLSLPELPVTPLAGRLGSNVTMEARSPVTFRTVEQDGLLVVVFDSRGVVPVPEGLPTKVSEYFGGDARGEFSWADAVDRITERASTMVE